MKHNATLLIEIDHPDFPEPNRLMCGGNFEVLRINAIGDEIYGLKHQDEEYLLFPVDFHAHDAGVLKVHIPASYEEHCFDAASDGARIRFKAPHGTPFFAEMPEEYWSDSGTVHVDEATGLITVTLDKVEPGHGPHGRANHEGCGCGHDHGPDGHRHNHAAHTHGEDCGCGHGAPSTTDAELAKALRAQAGILNALLVQAEAAGLLVDIAVDEGGDHSGVQLRVTRILRPL